MNNLRRTKYGPATGDRRTDMKNIYEQQLLRREVYMRTLPQEYEPIVEEPPKKPKRGALAKVLTVCAIVATVAAVSFVSIVGYIMLTDYSATPPAPEPTAQPIQASQLAQAAVEAAEATPEPTPQAVQRVIVSETEAMTIPDIAVKVKPSVVGIVCQHADDPVIGANSGSGIIMSEDGYIITNSHVVDGASAITVVLNDDTRYDAVIVGQDDQSDLALIKVEATGLTPAEFGNSDACVDGESVVAIGNPLGLEFAGSITGGIISAVDRTIVVNSRSMNVIQTDASINSGNSGGPLVNMEGEVIGITSVKIVSTGAEGMGFAIPISDALPIIRELQTQGYVSGRPALGISGDDITELMSQWYRLPRGVYVTYIVENSGAQEAGVRAGDVIYGINETPIESMDELEAVCSNFEAGDKVVLSIFRNGQTGTIEVVLSEKKGAD